MSGFTSEVQKTISDQYQMAADQRAAIQRNAKTRDEEDRVWETDLNARIEKAKAFLQPVTTALDVLHDKGLLKYDSEIYDFHINGRHVITLQTDIELSSYEHDWWIDDRRSGESDQRKWSGYQHCLDNSESSFTVTRLPNSFFWCQRLEAEAKEFRGVFLPLAHEYDLDRRSFVTIVLNDLAEKYRNKPGKLQKLKEAAREIDDHTFFPPYSPPVQSDLSPQP